MVKMLFARLPSVAMQGLGPSAQGLRGLRECKRHDDDTNETLDCE